MKRKSENTYFIINWLFEPAKTTLLNHILKNQEGYKVAIVNDIGEINVDQKLIDKMHKFKRRHRRCRSYQWMYLFTLKLDLLQQLSPTHPINLITSSLKQWYLRANPHCANHYRQ